MDMRCGEIRKRLSKQKKMSDSTQIRTHVRCVDVELCSEVRCFLQSVLIMGFECDNKQ